MWGYVAAKKHLRQCNGNAALLRPRRFLMLAYHPRIAYPMQRQRYGPSHLIASVAMHGRSCSNAFGYESTCSQSAAGELIRSQFSLIVL